MNLMISFKSMYETMLNPKYDLADAKSFKDLINRTQAMLMVLKKMKKDGLKYESCDHIHFFYTKNPKIAKKWKMRKMTREELED